MKNAILIIAFFCFDARAFAQENDSLVFFNNRLEWSSFKGTPNNDTAGAQISTSIYLEIAKVSIWNGKILFKAEASMNTFHSWVKTGYKNEYTLLHEQTHFNITEIHARRLQIELNRMKIKLIKSPIIQATFIKWQEKSEAMQRQYDKETNGGIDRVAQNNWNEKILAQLNSTDFLP